MQKKIRLKVVEKRPFAQEILGFFCERICLKQKKGEGFPVSTHYVICRGTPAPVQIAKKNIRFFPTIVPETKPRNPKYRIRIQDIQNPILGQFLGFGERNLRK
jgi:hypothetical protein